MPDADTIQGLFEAHVKKMPQRIAVIDASDSITYEALNQRANSLAHDLIARGVRPDTCVAICMDRRIDLLVALLAVLKAGAGYLPLDSTHPQERLLYCLKDNNDPFLIIPQSFQGIFSSYNGTCITLEQQSSDLIHNPCVTVQGQHLAYIIYTSGSTGNPKGVLIEREGVLNYIRWFAQYSQCQAGQRMDFSGNYIFDMAVTTTIASLALGLTLVIAQEETKKTAHSYLEYLARYEINFAKLTPSYFKLLVHEIKNNPHPLPHLQRLILGGENLSKLECKQWLRCFPSHRISNEYGPTEVTVAVSEFTVDRKNIAGLGGNIPIGLPGPNMDWTLLDEQQKPVSVGTTGELYVSGQGLARGYLNQEEMTSEKFIHLKNNVRFYKTGDLCRQKEGGVLEYLGRIDSQVKIRGYRVELQEVERQICAHPHIKDAIVHVDEYEEPRLVAYFILKDQGVILRQVDLRAFLAEHLPEYMVPAIMMSVPFFPLTANGKLDKKALPKPVYRSEQPYQAPSTPLEKKLTKLWTKELHVKPISLFDNFFELGGHSLAAARIISDIQHQLKKTVPLLTFYQATNLAQLAIAVNKIPKVRHSIHLRASAGRVFPLGMFQLTLWISRTFEPKTSQLNIVARKRIAGAINKEQLLKAFTALIQKHEVFSYRIFKFRPAQMVSPQRSFKLSEHDLSTLGLEECDFELEDSIQELVNYRRWAVKRPLIHARLFHLPQNQVELQICMPHLISDDLSPDIVFEDLSYFYLHQINEPPVVDSSYKEYVLFEHEYNRENQSEDIHFWDNYLSDASLFSFPQAAVISKMKASHMTYSSYVSIPGLIVDQVKNYCSEQHVSLNHGLSAALILALQHCCALTSQDKKIVLNLVKSTRTQMRYDQTIGCFLRTEPLKVSLNKQASLLELARQMQQSELETNAYQNCSSLLKLACIKTIRESQSPAYFILKSVTSICSMLLPWAKINKKLISIYQRLISFRRNKHFLININIQNNFVSRDLQNNKSLFNAPVIETRLYQHDLLTVDSLLDLSFLYANHEYYVVISANLTPEFRNQIAQTLIQILKEEVLIEQV